MKILSKSEMQKILNTLMADIIGGRIQCDACVVDDGMIEFHCWDGKRFLLTQQADGCKYDPQTGIPISV